ncbi:hypothetical protein PLANTIT3_60270 [Plantibacter sp. T3]|nr:hypothetical protein PLANTIT3_60270 [Plantibacter sp. T3]
MGRRGQSARAPLLPAQRVRPRRWSQDRALPRRDDRRGPLHPLTHRSLSPYPVPEPLPRSLSLSKGRSLSRSPGP